MKKRNTAIILIIPSFLFIITYSIHFLTRKATPNEVHSPSKYNPRLPTERTDSLTTKTVDMTKDDYASNEKISQIVNASQLIASQTEMHDSNLHLESTSNNRRSRDDIRDRFLLDRDLTQPSKGSMSTEKQSDYRKAAIIISLGRMLNWSDSIKSEAEKRQFQEQVKNLILVSESLNAEKLLLKYNDLKQLQMNLIIEHIH